MSRKIKFTEEQKQLIYDMYYNQLEGILAIAKHFNVTDSVIKRILVNDFHGTRSRLEQLRIQAKKRIRQFTKDQINEIAKMYYDQQMTLKDMQEALKIDHRTLKRILIEELHGLRSDKENHYLRVRKLKGRKITGQALENIRQGILRSRSTKEYREMIGKTKQGEKNAHAKLTADKVRLIRIKYKAAIETGHERTETQYRLAEEFGVSRSAILDIIHKRTWKHLE